MFELQAYPKHVCMYVWQAPKQVCMYVCLRLLSKYVCMSHSQLQNQLVSEGVKFLIKTLQNLTLNFFFFLIVRGGTSGSIARLQTCMYVCLSSRPTLSMYVCTSDRPKQVCMYVWGLLSMYVCMSQAAERVCMYVWDSWASMYVCLKQLSVYVCYVLSVYVCFKYVCMSQRAKIYVCMDVSDIHT